MNRTFLYPVLILIGMWFLNCSPTQSVVSDDQESLPHTVLWKIESNGLEDPSYLMGTIHIIPDELYFWPEHFQSALDASSQVALETNELDMDPASMMGIMPKLMLPNGQSIEDLVSEEDYTLIENYLDGLGLPLSFLKNIKPFFLYMLIDIDLGSMFKEGVKSYEMEITEKAKQKNKPVLGLETLNSQIAIFDSIPYQEQAELLVQSVEQKVMEKDAPEGNNSLNDLYQTYVDQNLNAMLAEIEETDVTIQKYNKLFLDNRNKAWIPKIKKFIHDKPTFIAVGAAHLPGKMGVIRLMQKAGYTMTPILNESHGTN